jgi:thiamine biosynthesis lipoprotein
MQEDTKSVWSIPLMGGLVNVTFYDVPLDIAEPFFPEMGSEARRLDGIFNFYSPKSELSRLNCKRTIQASDELLEVIKTAIRFSRTSEGGYDVTLGRQFLARKQRIALPSVGCSFKDISVKADTVTLEHPDALIDLSSIAKGYIVDRLTDHMKSIGLEGGFVEARGDMRIFGRQLEVVWVQHPRNRGKLLRPIVLDNMAVATSGDYNQHDGDYTRCHILGCKRISSATAIAKTAMEADAAATCLMIVGADGAESFLANHRDIKAYCIGEDLTEAMYNGFQEYQVPEAMLNG